MSGKPRVCIIGCGPSGMSALYHFTKLPADIIPDILCYEKQKTWGGQWNPSWRTGFDEYGEPVHSTIYPHLMTNVPKEVMEYPDYTFQQHFGRPMPSYVDAKTTREYLEARMKRGGQRDLLQVIKFSTVVRGIKYNSNTERFTATVHDLQTDHIYDVTDFTHVIVAVGMFSVPYLPTLSGIEHFTGRILHSRDFRQPADFKGKNILIIGSGYSAQDIAQITHRNGASRIICSWKVSPMGYKWPKGIEERPEVDRFEKNTVRFSDGSFADVDMVIFCTGYQKHFTFLPENLRLNETLSYHVDHLYKGILWMKGGDNRLLYLGMQNQAFTFPMFDVQALWACKYITGRLQIPDKTTMLQDIERWGKRHDEKVKDAHTAVDFQTEYVIDLSNDVDVGEYPNKFKETSALFHKWINSKVENINTYRQKRFTSVYSGVEATPLS